MNRRDTDREQTTKVGLVRASAMASTVLCLLAWGVPAGAQTFAGTPELLTTSVGDRDARDALAAGFNLPLMLRPDMPDGEAAAVVATEVQRLAGILRSFGYLDATVRVEKIPLPGITTSAGEATGDAGATVRLVPETGPLYRVGSVTVHGALGAGLTQSLQDDLAVQLGRFAGTAARADILEKIELDIPRYLSRNSYPFAEMKNRQLHRDPSMALVGLELWLDPGPVTRFGEVTFSGLIRTDQKALTPLIEFSPGDPYDSLLLDKLKQRLEDLGRFWVVRVNHAPQPEPDGRVAIDVKVLEKSPPQQVLEQRGAEGRMVTLVTLAVVGVTQMIAVTGKIPRLTRLLAVISFGLIAASALFAVQRVLGFLVAG
jgi:hypothetical protein